MAKTYAFAIGGAIALALTLTPVLASKLIPAQSEEKDSLLMRGLGHFYNPMFDFVVHHARWVAPLVVVPIIATVALFSALGREFMPKLEEGNFWIRATLPMSISLDQSAKYVGRMRNIVRAAVRPRGRRRLRQKGIASTPRSWPWSRSSGDRTMGRMSRASTTSSSSRRSSPSTSGRPG